MGMPDHIREWRKEQRKALLALRMAVPADLHHQRNETITRLIVEGFPLLERMTVSLYWPFRGEFDPRFAIRQLRERGATAALPVLVEKAAPLQFRQWWPGAPTVRGPYDLPMPDGTPLVVPQAMLIPPIGFDARGYRLGYGGGYFDRTLAAMMPQPLKIGVAFELSRIGTIRPQPHDIPMDFIVTEAGIHRVEPGGLRRVDEPREAAELAEQLVRERARGVNQHAIPPSAIPAEDHRAEARRYASSPFDACRPLPGGEEA